MFYMFDKVNIFSNKNLNTVYCVYMYDNLLLPKSEVPVVCFHFATTLLYTLLDYICLKCVVKKHEVCITE